MARKSATKAQATEETKVEAVVDNTTAEAEKQEKPTKAAAKEEAKGEVVRETVQQLGIFSDYIYNVLHKGAVIVVENLGYGDVYISTDGLAQVGKSKRLMFKESVKFEGVDKLYLVSASQPVVQILEVK
jgi:hypothetical protein